MKQYLVYFGLFVTFAATLGSAQYLDDYSKHYVDCAQKWETSIKLAENQKALAKRLLEMTDRAEMTVEGKTCPLLREDHFRQISSELEALVNA